MKKAIVILVLFWGNFANAQTEEEKKILSILRVGGGEKVAWELTSSSLFPFQGICLGEGVCLILVSPELESWEVGCSEQVKNVYKAKEKEILFYLPAPDSFRVIDLSQKRILGKIPNLKGELPEVLTDETGKSYLIQIRKTESPSEKLFPFSEIYTLEGKQIGYFQGKIVELRGGYLVTEHSRGGVTYRTRLNLKTGETEETKK